MEPVTKRDVVDAKAFAEKGGLGWESIDDFDGFIHDLAQAIADGRRTTRMSLIEQLGNHLTGRYVPFSGQQPTGHSLLSTKPMPPASPPWQSTGW